MKKVVKRTIKEKKVVDFTPEVKEEKVINTLELNLGRDDLNEVVGKLNEVITHLNKCQ